MSAPESNPLVSVIMATHNRAAYLERSIQSVFDQEYKALELVVINDGSADETAVVLSQFQSDHRLKVLVNEKNLGLQKSLNRGIASAKGSFIARIDDDDCWTDTGKLRRQVSFMMKDSQCGLLGTAYIDEWGAESHNPTSDEEIRRQMLFRCPFCHSSVMIRGSALEHAGNYDEDLPYAEDWDLWMRIGRQWRLANLDEVTLRREQGSDTLSEQYFSRQLKIAQILRKRHGDNYPGAMRARVYHAFSILFFSLFPPGGSAHKFMARVFTKTFGLAARDSANA